MDEQQKSQSQENSRFLQNYSAFLALELIQLGRYFNRMDSVLKENQSQLVQESLAIQEFIADDITVKNAINSEHRDLILDPMSTYNAEIRMLHPHLLFSSFIITLYSLLERNLMKICQALDIKISISINDKAISDKGIDRVSVFLKKGINYEIDNPHWKVLKTVQSIRNKLVHGDQTITFKSISNDKKVYHYLRLYQLCEAEEAPIIFNSQYCQHLIEFSLIFFDKIFKDIGFENSDCFKLELLPWNPSKPMEWF